MRSSFTLFFLTLLLSCQHSPKTAEGLLQKSTTYHFAETSWYSFTGRLHFTHLSKDAPTRHTWVDLDFPNAYFAFTEVIDGDTLAQIVDKGTQTVLWKGKEFTASRDSLAKVVQRWKVDPAYWKASFEFLNGLPYKALDSAAIVSKAITERTIKGTTVQEVKVHFKNGSETWFFGVEPTSGQMQYYSFYFDTNYQHGEYIPLEETVDYKGIRFPKYRKWHSIEKGDTTYLATDVLDSVTTR